MGGEWRAEERWGRSRGFYTPAVDSVLRGLDHLGLGSEAVLSGWRCGLSSVVWTRSSGVCRANGQKQKFRRRAGFSCHGREAQVVGHAGRGWRVVRASMPCRCTCGARGKGACTTRNGYAALGVQSVHGRGQSTGCRATNGRRGWQQVIGHRRRWLGAASGVVVGASLTPAPWSARGSSRWPRASRERERGWGRAGTSRWGSRVHLGGGSTLIGG
jgi:hypothetical protein